ncbi:MAG: TMEM175 family protein, partial [Anaerolineae bacterium]
MRPKASPASDDKLGLERIVFFSDAVMAIAITLLALDIRVPQLGPATSSEQLAAALKVLAPRFMT